MSQNGSSTSRQDFIAKVRYINDLPPPPCPPKLLNIKTDEASDFLTSSALLSSFFRKDNFKNLITLNDNLGLNMNLLDVPDCIENNDISSICKLSPDYGDELKLHPDDQLLLIDPSKSANALKSDSVSFLRRTQYISSDRQQVPAMNETSSSIKHKINSSKNNDELDPKLLLRSVEEMFGTTATTDINKLKHPTKKNLKAKKVWNFLPDTSMMDQKYFDIKFVSSASITKGKNRRKEDIKSENDPRLLTAMFREIEFNKETSLVSLYTTSEENAKEIKTTFDDQTENAPITEEERDMTNPLDNQAYIYKKVRDYDGQVKPFQDNESFRHLAITFDESTSSALYVPISGKVELKKRRIDPYLEPKIKELTYDQIYLKIREPTRNEIDGRDMLRSNYDPMEFGAADDDEEEEEEANEE